MQRLSTLVGSCLIRRKCGSMLSRTAAAVMAPSCTLAAVSQQQQRRSYATPSEDALAAVEALKRPEVASRLNEWIDSFGEARELIKDAMDSVGTTYFSEDMEDAAKQTQDTMQRWEDIMKLLTDSGDAAAVARLQREHELKMKQIKEELEMAQHAGGD